MALPAHYGFAGMYGKGYIGKLEIRNSKFESNSKFE